MKLDILDSYNIRARLSPNIILLGPIALTLSICFEGLYTTVSSTVFLVILLALTNYVPILQRRLAKRNLLVNNYAARLLQSDNNEIDKISKKRYYDKLASLDSSFSLFKNPTNTEAFQKCCESAVIYLRNKTRDNHLVLEENINYGFCKNMLLNKPLGIVINIVLSLFAFFFSWKASGNTIVNIPSKNWLAIGINLFFIVFWIWGINQKILKESSKRYAYTLITAIDSLKTEGKN